ncbi:MAG: type II toxin-antitoxin system ParD family antitoxin [Alphaproteobacteria bacterium]|nr:type II toxin-antitoxin system ParD family antitoxin [Alphaproteobacteria bacterium]
MTLSISLTPQLENMVRAKIDSGMYSSASEVVREALRLLDEQDQLRKNRLETLRRDIDAGIKSGRGRKATAEDVIKRARFKKKNMR